MQNAPFRKAHQFPTDDAWLEPEHELKFHVFNTCGFRETDDGGSGSELWAVKPFSKEWMQREKTRYDIREVERWTCWWKGSEIPFLSQQEIIRDKYKWTMRMLLRLPRPSHPCPSWRYSSYLEQFYRRPRPMRLAWGVNEVGHTRLLQLSNVRCSRVPQVVLLVIRDISGMMMVLVSQSNWGASRNI